MLVLPQRGLLDPTPAGATWVALSEITHLGDDRYAVIERDNNWGALAAVKRVYAFRLDGVQPFEGTVTARVRNPSLGSLVETSSRKSSDARVSMNGGESTSRAGGVEQVMNLDRFDLG